VTTLKHRPPSRAFDLDRYAGSSKSRSAAGLTLNQLARKALGSLEAHVESIQARRRLTSLEEVAWPANSAGTWRAMPRPRFR
jgi:hypothetical protein